MGRPSGLVAAAAGRGPWRGGRGVGRAKRAGWVAGRVVWAPYAPGGTAQWPGDHRCARRRRRPRLGTRTGTGRRRTRPAVAGRRGGLPRGGPSRAGRACRRRAGRGAVEAPDPRRRSAGTAHRRRAAAARRDRHRQAGRRTVQVATGPDRPRATGRSPSATRAEARRAYDDCARRRLRHSSKTSSGSRCSKSRSHCVSGAGVAARRDGGRAPRRRGRPVPGRAPSRRTVLQAPEPAAAGWTGGAHRYGPRRVVDSLSPEPVTLRA